VPDCGIHAVPEALLGCTFSMESLRIALQLLRVTSCCVLPPVVPGPKLSVAVVALHAWQCAKRHCKVKQIEASPAGLSERKNERNDNK